MLGLKYVVRDSVTTVLFTYNEIHFYFLSTNLNMFYFEMY